MDTNQRTVKFDSNCSPYLSGECATFPIRQAATLVTRGIAHYVQKDKDGQWVPVEGESNVDVHTENAGIDGSGEPKSGNEQQSGGDQTAPTGDDGNDNPDGEPDDDDGSDNGSDESDSESDDDEPDDDSDDESGDDTKKQAGRKRGRVKL